jgi:hypothetical protein
MVGDLSGVELDSKELEETVKDAVKDAVREVVLDAVEDVVMQNGASSRKAPQPQK